MKAMDESFDNELGRRLKQFSEEPEAALWSSITERIEAGDRTIRIRKKTRAGWVFIFASIAIGEFFYLFNLESKQSLLTKSEESRKNLNGNVSDEGGSTSSADTHFQLQDKPATSETGAENSTRTEINHQSKKLLAIENDDVIANASEKHGDALNDFANRFEPSDESNFSVVPDGALDSNSFSIVKTDVMKNPAMDQDNTVDTKQQPNRLRLYFTIMPTLGYQRIKPNSNDNLIVESIERVSTFSTDRLGVRAELGVEYPVGNRLNIFGGLVYFQRQQTIGYTEKVVSNTDIVEGPDGEIIVQPEFGYESRSFEYEVRNVGVQVGLNYQLAKRKFLQMLGTGVEFHLALNKFGERREITNNPSAYIFYNLYYRLQYPADTKLRAVVQPTLNYSFYINQNRDAPFHVKPYGLGMNVGFTYNFK
jgi:hypothetical protein